MTWHWSFDSLEPGILQKRYKRFLADVTLQNGEVVVAHCPNTGAMRGCQQPGSRVWLSRSDNPKRKLAWTLELVEDNGDLVCVHSVLANRVVEAALHEGIIPELAGFDRLHREVNLGTNTRVDFRLEAEAAPIWVEVKAVSWCVGDGLGQFPDAVSARARKHVLELAGLVNSGCRGALVFCAFHSRIERIAAAVEVDPEYAEALSQAVQAGVEVYGLSMNISPQGLRAVQPLSMEGRDQSVR
ncbi:MAG: DNA/RNA nuclease SfsA [Luminiphilus sp.]|nr:DNA/RNA nuclease SfsA [Luminiphilus sp.]